MKFIQYEKSKDASIDDYNLFQTRRTGRILRFLNNRFTLCFVSDGKPYAIYTNKKTVWRRK